MCIDWVFVFCFWLVRATGQPTFGDSSKNAFLLFQNPTQTVFHKPPCRCCAYISCHFIIFLNRLNLPKCIDWVYLLFICWFIHILRFAKRAVSTYFPSALDGHVCLRPTVCPKKELHSQVNSCTFSSVAKVFCFLFVN